MKSLKDMLNESLVNGRVFLEGLSPTSSPEYWASVFKAKKDDLTNKRKEMIEIAKDKGLEIGNYLVYWDEKTGPVDHKEPIIIIGDVNNKKEICIAWGIESSVDSYDAYYYDGVCYDNIDDLKSRNPQFKDIDMSGTRWEYPSTPNIWRSKTKPMVRHDEIEEAIDYMIKSATKFLSKIKY